MIEFYCSHCGVRIRTPDEFSGKKGKCPKCHKAVLTPSGTIAPFDLPGSNNEFVKYKCKCKECKSVLESPTKMGGKEDICPDCETVNTVPYTKEQLQFIKSRQEEQWGKNENEEQSQELGNPIADKPRMGRPPLITETPSNEPLTQETHPQPLDIIMEPEKKAQKAKKVEEDTPDNLDTDEKPLEPIDELLPADEPIAVIPSENIITDPSMYSAVKVMAMIFIILGGVALIAGSVILGLTIKAGGHIFGILPLVLGLAISGIVQMGLGQICYCVRDIARNSHYLKRLK